MATTDAETEELVAAVERADRRFREVTGRIEEVGESRVETVAEAHEEATSLLDRYEGRATGTGDFRAFVEFQEKFSDLVEGLDEDLPRHEAFEKALETVDKRRVSESDFDQARDRLDHAGSVADLLEERKAARESYRDARGALQAERDRITDEIDRLERLESLGEADLDAPTDRLRDPIEAYNRAVEEAFREFRRDRPAREVLGFVADTEAFPLVAFRQPPEELYEYVREYDAGTEPIPTLLEYADYSRSKLGHYVEDPDELKRRVATQQTYLERLDAEPLTVEWPPPPADRVRYEARELVAVCGRFAPGSVVERARRVGDLPHDTDYGRLREAAVAAERLSDDQRRRLESGGIADEIAALRDRLATIEDALDEYPER